MRGKQVIVRDFRKRALVRRIWDADKGAVYITDDEGLEKLGNGDPGAPWPIGFPRGDVFAYDHEWGGGSRPQGRGAGLGRFRAVERIGWAPISN